MTEMAAIVPNDEKSRRMVCLQLAISASHPDEAATVAEIVRVAETFYRYVDNGEAASDVRPVLKAV